MDQGITAICVSHSSRRGLLQQAVRSFMEQAHQPRELLILINEPGYYSIVREDLLKVLPQVPIIPERCGHPRRWLLTVFGQEPGARIHLQLSPFKTPSEALLQAAAWASYPWIACWDDDDMSHPDRLKVQQEQSEGLHGMAVVLGQSLYYFYDSNELFVTEYRRPGGAAHERCAAASLLLRRQGLPPIDLREPGPWSLQVLANLDNDYWVFGGDPRLMVIGSNGDNWRSAAFHRRMGSNLPGTWLREYVLRRAEEVESWLPGYEFPQDVYVCGKDAQAFKAICRTDTSLPVLPPEDWRERLPSPEREKRLAAEQRAKQTADRRSRRVKQNARK